MMNVYLHRPAALDQAEARERTNENCPVPRRIQEDHRTKIILLKYEFAETVRLMFCSDIVHPEVMVEKDSILPFKNRNSHCG